MMGEICCDDKYLTIIDGGNTSIHTFNCVYNLLISIYMDIDQRQPMKQHQQDDSIVDELKQYVLVHHKWLPGVVQ